VTTYALLQFIPLVVVVLLAGWIANRVPADKLGSLRALPDARLAPAVAGVVMMSIVWYLWGSLHQVPVVHDEASYLLQAETFARGRWAMPRPPIPAFFEQFHVFVTPTYASKYWPGHGILLVPGIWFHAPGLVPILLNGAAAALLFMLVRRVANGWVAVLTLVLWIPLRGTLLFRPSYFSENTTSALWLLGWFALLEWRESTRQRWLVVVAGCIAWMTITRPLTGVAYAIPIGVVVIRDVARSRDWHSLVRPALLALAVVALIPIWSARTTGNWRMTPYASYTKRYLPFDRVGFGADTSPPDHPLPADMAQLAQAFTTTHATHTVRKLPKIFYDRWQVMVDDAFHGPRKGLALFVVAALIVLPAAGWFAVVSSVLVTIAYLAYAHPAGWDLYYLEINPLLPFLTASGIWAVWLAASPRPRTERRVMLRTIPPSAAFAGLLLFLFLVLPARAEILRMHREQMARRQYPSQFAAGVARLPERQTIVFIRYRQDHNFNSSLIANQADLPDARAWLVYDRGGENRALIELAPDRAPYLYNDSTATFQRLDARGAAGAALPGK
jgi:hypothetical protein